MAEKKAKNSDAKKPENPSSNVGICHVFNVFDVNATLPFPLAPGTTLRRATANERGYISRCMRVTSCSGWSHCNFHEFDWKFEPQQIFVEFDTDEEKWRYHVIEFPVDGHFNPGGFHHTTLRRAAWVSEPRFKWAIYSPKDQPPPWPLPTADLLMGIWAEHEIEFLRRRQAIPALSESDLKDFIAAYDQLTTLDKTYSFIPDAIDLYANSFDVHVESPLRVLAFFAIIELLVTHKPKRSDTGDALTRQVKTKLQLLAKRFAQPLQPQDVFSVKSNTFGWELIYNFRSLIAHGGTVDFAKDYKGEQNDNGAKQLVNNREILFFLGEFTRRLLRHSLTEPLLIADLKEC